MNTKLKLLTISISTLLFSGASFATEETSALTTTGNLVESSCDFEFQDGTGSPVTTMALPDISESDVFKLTEGDIATDFALQQSINLNFSSCQNTEKVQIDFTEDEQSGVAVGVSIVLLDGASEADTETLADFDLSGVDNGSQVYNIGYKRTAANDRDVVVGNMAKVFNFTVKYL